MLKLVTQKLSYKKGRSVILLPFFIFIVSCKTLNPGQYGRVTLHNTNDKNSFTFSITEEFTSATKDAKQDKENPKMNEAEAQLLTALLKQQKYCLLDGSKPSFIITSRQEKIYDMTFAHLIEESYNARPVAPRMYFGQCKKKKEELS